MDPSAFRAFTFDCYGTLIDWEQGILRAFRALPGIDADDDTLLAAFARHEHTVQEADPAALYPVVLGRVCKAVAADFGHAATDEQARAFAASIADWPPFPDTIEALAYLKQQGLLMVLSNVDRASFAHSARRLGDPFHAVVTAEDVGSYKPAPGPFRAGHGVARRTTASRPARCCTWPRASSTMSCRAARPASPPAGSTAAPAAPAVPRRRSTWSRTSPSTTSPQLAAWHRAGGL